MLSSPQLTAPSPRASMASPPSGSCRRSTRCRCPRRALPAGQGKRHGKCRRVCSASERAWMMMDDELRVRVCVDGGGRRRLLSPPSWAQTPCPRRPRPRRLPPLQQRPLLPLPLRPPLSAVPPFRPARAQCVPSLRPSPRGLRQSWTPPPRAASAEKTAQRQGSVRALAPCSRHDHDVRRHHHRRSGTRCRQRRRRLG